MLHGLLRGSVLSQPDRVMRQDVDDGEFHDGGQAHCRSDVVSEDQEARAKRPNLGQGHPIAVGAHGKLPDSKMDVSAAVLSGGEVSGALSGESGLGRRSQIRCPPDEPGRTPCNGVENPAGRIARRQPFGISGKRRQVEVPARGKFTMLHAVQLIRQARMSVAMALE